MRLSNEKAESLKHSITAILPNVKIYLFGSRVDDSKKGGDIDLLILANRKLSFTEQSHIKWQFFKKFGEQKIDLVSYQYKDTDPFKAIALTNAIEL